MVAFLVVVGLLAAFSMALLHPYGRKVLGVMVLVCLACGFVLWALIANADRQAHKTQDAASYPGVPTIPAPAKP